MVNDAAGNKSGILIFDVQPLILAGLTQIINRESDMICCGEARSPQCARQLFLACKPDLVTIELEMPDGDGFKLIKEFKKMEARIPILIISQYDEMFYAERALRAGARGYLMKENAAEDVVFAIRTILKGEMYVSKKVAALALHQMAGRRGGEQSQNVGMLTNRELQVFQLFGSGLGIRAVAIRLNLSTRTVEQHWVNIKRRLGIKDAAKLIQYATTWVNRNGKK